MSGIYIPGMEMPNCDECFWCIGHRIKCPAGSENVLVGGRHPKCPLISVPDHGRMGDLDALASEIQVSLEEGDSWMNSPIKMAQRAMRVADLRRIRSAPTIIPASTDKG